MTAPPRVRQIVADAAREHGFSTDRILARDRSRKVSLARDVAIQRVREATGASTTTIGKWFARDHSSIVASLRRSTERDAA